MKTVFALATTIAAFTSFVSAAEAPKTEQPEQPVVQVAILLDNSGSMSGLISQAKSQLWSIVNEFVAAKQDGKAPRVQVALYEYGISDTPAKEGYIRQLSGLTDDLDKLSEKLFAISSRNTGSEEYCGRVIKEAVEKLEWDKSSKTYKAIFIAGNEPFTQGQVPYASACKSAIEHGIMVNTIHCGTEAEGVSGEWKNGAAIADGKFLVINHNEAVAAVAAPQDKQIAELNTKLNGTYVAFGKLGAEGKMRQQVQDQNAAAAPSAMSGRAASKAASVYYNGSWDLVDRSKEKEFDLATMPADQLPEEMKKMSAEERKAYLDKKTAERADIQQQIGKLAKERDAFVAANSNSKDATLGKAVSVAVRDQAGKKGLIFEKK